MYLTVTRTCRFYTQVGTYYHRYITSINLQCNVSITQACITHTCIKLNWLMM